jgi:hypothetical protein
MAGRRARQHFGGVDVSIVVEMVADHMKHNGKITRTNAWGDYVLKAIKYVLLGKGEQRPELPPPAGTIASIAVEVTRDCLATYLELNHQQARPDVLDRLDELLTVADYPKQGRD